MWNDVNINTASKSNDRISVREERFCIACTLQMFLPSLHQKFLHHHRLHLSFPSYSVTTSEFFYLLTSQTFCREKCSWSVSDCRSFSPLSLLLNNKLLQSISINFSLKCSKPRSELRKFVVKFNNSQWNLTSRFVNKVSDWLHVRKQPIKC